MRRFPRRGRGPGIPTPRRSLLLDHPTADEHRRDKRCADHDRVATPGSPRLCVTSWLATGDATPVATRDRRSRRRAMSHTSEAVPGRRRRTLVAGLASGTLLLAACGGGGGGGDGGDAPGADGNAVVRHRWNRRCLLPVRRRMANVLRRAARRHGDGAGDQRLRRQPAARAGRSAASRSPSATRSPTASPGGHTSTAGRAAVHARQRLYDNFTHPFTMAGTGIRSVEDLRGKRVSVGSPGSATEVIAIRIMEAAGLNPRDRHPALPAGRRRDGRRRCTTARSTPASGPAACRPARSSTWRAPARWC